MIGFLPVEGAQRPAGPMPFMQEPPAGARRTATPPPQVSAARSARG